MVISLRQDNHQILEFLMLKATLWIICLLAFLVSFIYTFSLYFLVYLYFNLVSSILVLFSRRIVSEIITQLIEFYQSSCHEFCLTRLFPRTKSSINQGVSVYHIILYELQQIIFPTKHCILVSILTYHFLDRKTFYSLDITSFACSLII